MANNNTPALEFIYAIQSVNLRNVKIGFSTDVNQRLAGMQTGSPDELKVIGCWPGSQAEEQMIHGQMAQWRLHREWFFPSPEVLALVGERNRAVKAEASGKLRIDLADGRSVEIWETCRDDQRHRYKITDSYRAAVDITNKARQLASALPPHYAVIADEIVAAAQVVFSELNRPSAKPRPIQEVSPADRHCFEIRCGARHVYSAGSKAHALRLWMAECSPGDDAPTDVTIIRLLDTDPVTVSQSNGQDVPPITRTYKEYAESREGFLGTRIELPVVRHCYLIQSSMDYAYSAKSKAHALQLWLKDYWPRDDGVSNLSIKQLPDDGKFNYQHNDEAKTTETKTYREWADSKEGLIAIFFKTAPFDYPPMIESKKQVDALTAEVATLKAETDQLKARIQRLQQPRQLTWSERLKGTKQST